MKKMNNKGFSLVELIIVIAIMAILAGAIAPALIRFIDKSRRSNDVSAAKTIKTAVENTLASENIYTLIVPKTPATGGVAAPTIITLTPTDDETDLKTQFNTLNPNTVADADMENSTLAKTQATLASEIAKSLKGKVPGVKYKKWGATVYNVVIDANGEVRVYLSKAAMTAANVKDAGTAGYTVDAAATEGKDGTYWLLTPDICEYYQ